ncbi:hypothetical protein PENTCL1PPCAC_11077 [Pristionchus entomophagus]|uniref:Uncharacterized protein n=1 Tax=Pristionchus entomophagus TaxID=358040 RepID=A0AAV5T000_9BILA|nr:hypothetical protein PENTCL1PPCAC_11077 [Pristionchus entomophagus]
MGVLGNYYNYQIAVIFAILIGGLIVLGGTVAGIYYVCIANMREDKKKLTSHASPSPWHESSVAYRPAEPVPSSQYAPTPSLQQMPQQQQYMQQPYLQQQQQYQPYSQQYDTGYNRSNLPSPMSAQPQPLLAPQSYDPYQPQYNDMRTVTMQQQPSRSFNQSSV